MKKAETAEQEVTEMYKAVLQKSAHPLLIQGTKLRYIPEDVYHQPLGDMETVIVMEHPVSGKKSLVDAELLKKLGMEGNELLESIKSSNTFRAEVSVRLLDDIADLLISGEEDLTHLSGVDLDNPTWADRAYSRTVVVSNTSGKYGAAGILSDEVMKKLSDIFADDMVIIPSSVHECLVMPAEGVDLDDIREMIYKTNREDVHPDEWLSDEPYVYDRELKKVIMPGEKKKQLAGHEPNQQFDRKIGQAR